MFVSVDGKSKEVAEIYAGGTDGKAHKITELFGSVDGTAKLLWSDVSPEPNGFDSFTWAEIKQLANEGKLLEHFKLFDRVNIKLKTPLESEMYVYLKGVGKYMWIPQRQDEMMFQIVELSETKMRLMSPRVNAVGIANSNLYTWRFSSMGYELMMPDYWQLFASHFDADEGDARKLSPQAWGMTSLYYRLKDIQHSLPDDLLDVLSITSRPLIRYERHFITHKLELEFDEDMKVGQISTNIWKHGVDTKTDYYTVYPIIHESYYPQTVGEYLYHIYLPEEYDTYEQRRYMVANMFKGVLMTDFTCDEWLDSNYHSRATMYRSWTRAPYASCYYSKGIKTHEEYEDFLGGAYLQNGSTGKDQPVSGYGTVIPEIVIKADL